jgi:hypothetical protein
MAKGSRRRGLGKKQTQKNYRPDPLPLPRDSHGFLALKKSLPRRGYHKLHFKLL